MGHGPDEHSDYGNLELARRRCDQFYRPDSISSYFYTRFAVLAALNANRDQLVEWCDSGIEFHGSHITIPSVDRGNDVA